MQYTKKITLLFALTIFLQYSSVHAERTPNLAIIFVVDQFAYRTLEKLKKYMNGGIKFLLKNGLIFTNAYHPHAMPATATGHTALNTGTFAKEHGITGNNWYDVQGNEVICDDDTAENAAVFSPTGFYNYGKSARNIMVDGISDQIILASEPTTPKQVFSISLKSRAAIACAGKLGKPFWFDEKSGNFTSSKAYFETLPEWVTTFNKKKNISGLKKVYWPYAFNRNSPAYNFDYIIDYRFIDGDQLVGKKLPVGEDYELFEKTPAAMQVTLDLAKKCIDVHYRRAQNDMLVVWISFSTPDKIGHKYGQESLEAIDCLYHLDRQLQSFMRWVSRKTNERLTLYALTADHGAGPIPEFMREQGISHAHRFLYPNVITELNTYISNNFGVKDLIYNFKSPAFFLNEQKINALPKETRKKLITEIKNFLLEHPAIKQVWTRHQLKNPAYACTEIASFFRNQIYRGRSGYIFIQTSPYSLATKYPHGTAHRSPYEYDRHVPLILYQRNKIGNRTIDQKVYTTQFANTLSYILQVPKPSASTFDMLPGIVNECAVGCY